MATLISREPRLTVAIPTFDRNETLRRTLPTLVPQLTDDCRLLIIDNCSATPVQETVADLLADVPTERYSIVRNRFNIGASANIMRCFEFCETEWLWVLGDDDVVRPDAIRTILEEVDACPTCVFFLFSVDGFYPVEHRRTMHGTHGLLTTAVRRLYDYEVLGFTSTTLYRAPMMQPFLRFGYQFTYTNFPHVALLLLALGEDQECRYIDKPIIRNVLTAPIAQTYDFTELLPGRTVMMDLPLSREVRDHLLRLFRNAPWTPKQVSLDLLGRIRQGRSRDDLLYRYDQVFARLHFRRGSPLLALQRGLYRNVVRFPRLSFWLISRVYYPYLKRSPMPTLGSTGQPKAYERL